MEVKTIVSLLTLAQKLQEKLNEHKMQRILHLLINEIGIFTQDIRCAPTQGPLRQAGWRLICVIDEILNEVQMQK